MASRSENVKIATEDGRYEIIKMLAILLRILELKRTVDSAHLCEIVDSVFINCKNVDVSAAFIEACSVARMETMQMQSSAYNHGWADGQAALVNQNQGWHGQRVSNDYDEYYEDNHGEFYENGENREFYKNGENGKFYENGNPGWVDQSGGNHHHFEQDNVEISGEGQSFDQGFDQEQGVYQCQDFEQEQGFGQRQGTDLGQGDDQHTDLQNESQTFSTDAENCLTETASVASASSIASVASTASQFDFKSLKQLSTLQSDASSSAESPSSDKSENSRGRSLTKKSSTARNERQTSSLEGSQSSSDSSVRTRNPRLRRARKQAGKKPQQPKVPFKSIQDLDKLTVKEIMHLLDTCDDDHQTLALYNELDSRNSSSSKKTQSTTHFVDVHILNEKINMSSPKLLFSVGLSYFAFYLPFEVQLLSTTLGAVKYSDLARSFLNIYPQDALAASCIKDLDGVTLCQESTQHVQNIIRGLISEKPTSLKDDVKLVMMHIYTSCFWGTLMATRINASLALQMIHQTSGLGQHGFFFKDNVSVKNIPSRIRSEAPLKFAMTASDLGELAMSLFLLGDFTSSLEILNSKALLSLSAVTSAHSLYTLRRLVEKVKDGIALINQCLASIKILLPKDTWTLFTSCVAIAGPSLGFAFDESFIFDMIKQANQKHIAKNVALKIQDRTPDLVDTFLGKEVYDLIAQVQNNDFSMRIICRKQETIILSLACVSYTPQLSDTTVNILRRIALASIMTKRMKGPPATLTMKSFTQFIQNIWCISAAEANEDLVVNELLVQQAKLVAELMQN